MALNKTLITWRAPTINTDGTPIDYELAYELLIDGEVTAVFPGRLNPAGLYEQEAEDLFPNTSFASYVVTLKAFRVDQPTEKSAESNAVTYAFDRRVPSPPFLLD